MSGAPVSSEGERDEAKHGEAAVPELGIDAHDGAAPGLGAVPLEQRHEQRDEAHGGRAHQLGQSGAGAGLDGERGHKAHHGEAAVGALGSRAAER